MFSDRFPTEPVTRYVRRRSPRPWGLTRMEPYGDTVEVDEVPVGLDPVTQTTVYRNSAGEIVTAKHRKTNTGTEDKTRTQNTGDGEKPSTDQDHSQDSDKD